MSDKKITHSLKLPLSCAAHIEEVKEDKEFDSIQSYGYTLECTAHETIKGNSATEKSIWSKNGKLFIGNYMSELKSFNGYVKNVYKSDYHIGTAVIDLDNPGYSLEEVQKDIEEFFGHSHFVLKD